MAVVNSTFQIALPGIDANAQNNLNTAINSNATIAQIISNFQSAGSFTSLNSAISTLQSSVFALPSTEPYPTFINYSNYQSSPYWTEFDSNMQFNGSFQQDTNAEIYSAYNSYAYTDSNGSISTNSITSYWPSGTPLHQADGHWLIRPHAASNGYSGKNLGYSNATYPYFGTVVSGTPGTLGSTGKRAKISLYINSSTIGIYPRGQYGAFESFSINSTTFATWYGGTTYGMIGYNERTSTLVVLEAKDANNNYRMHIWVNTAVDLNTTGYQTGTLYNFLSGAKAGGFGKSYNYYDFQWQAGSSQNYNESRYRMVVVPGDNNIVGLVRMVPSNQSQYAYYTPSSSTLTQLNTISLTTSYGIDQGNYYGMRQTITWDNTWVAAYNAYYYYGCGMNAYFIDSRDPRNYYLSQYSGTSYGAQLVPFKSNKFLFNTSDSNADGTVGMRLYIVDPEGSRAWGRTTGGTIANGGTIILTANQQAGLFDTYYTSTNYPVLIQSPYYRKGDIR